VGKNERIYTECEAVAWVTRRGIGTAEQLLRHPDYTMVNISDRRRLYALVRDIERHPLFAHKP
jgi:hypothetical protein